MSNLRLFFADLRLPSLFMRDEDMLEDELEDMLEYMLGDAVDRTGDVLE